MSLNFKNSFRIMNKDWSENIKIKEIFLPIIFLPIIFTIGMPILMLIGVLFDPAEYTSAFSYFPLELLNIPPYYNDYLRAASLMIKMLIMPFFLLIPGLLPSVIASDSFAGEKERKTMESLLLLPISKSELIIGKVLTSFIPSVIVNFICFLMNGLTVNLMLLPHLEGNILLFSDVTFLLMVSILAPILAFLNILIAIIISSRSKNLKSAQSINGALVLPIISVLFIQMFNPAFLSPLSVLIISLIIGGISIFFIDLANRLLDVEKLILMI
ncbi:MAG: ABC transporter permease [Promethearchaeota archaeon]|nr:MAG: ABC transporter permease [Candidatus Lokiarchaeota archaeon]